MNAPLCCWTGGRTDHCEIDDVYWWDCPKAETVTEYLEGDFNFIEIKDTSTFHHTEYALKLGNKRPGKRVYRCSYLEVDRYVYCDRAEQ